MAAATLITLRDEKKKSAAKGALEVFGPSTRGNAGKRGPVCLSNAGRTCRFQRGGKRIAADGLERRAARPNPGGVVRSGVDRAGRPHYLNPPGPFPPQVGFVERVSDQTFTTDRRLQTISGLLYKR